MFDLVLNTSLIVLKVILFILILFRLTFFGVLKRLGNKEAPFVKSVVLVLQLGEKVLDYFYDENFYAT